MKPQFSQRPRRGLQTSLIVSASLLALALLYLLIMPPPPPSGGPGYILSGSSSVLNPDGGDYVSDRPGDGKWTIFNNEYVQFEPLAGSGGANRPWQLLPNYGIEPTGSAQPTDIQAGGGCGNIDITSDSDGGYDYAYFSVIDPDGIANNGDELLALAVRLAQEVRGAFSFSLLLDAANDCGYDANATCGNPCFEYEIQISSRRNEVNLINIDGCSGQADCDAAHPANDGAYVCQPCNQEALQIQAGSGACEDSPEDAVIWMAYVPFDRLVGVSPDGDFRLVPTSTTSPNSVIYQNSNVADYGGVGDPNDASDCDCATQCAGQGCGDCLRDCALACVATRNRVGTSFPVEWLALSGTPRTEGVELRWATAQEQNNDYFEVERLTETGEAIGLGRVPGSGNSQAVQRYQFMAPRPTGDRGVYRIKQVDLDGQASYSSKLEVSLAPTQALALRVIAPTAQAPLQVRIDLPESRSLQVRILTLSGQQVHAQTTPLAAGQQVLTLSQVRLSAGAYLLVANDQRSGQQWQQKFRVP